MDLSVLFTVQGAAAFGALVDALNHARSGECDCQVCSMLRAVVDTLADALERSTGDGNT